MHICATCGEVFNDPLAVYDEDVCPSCGSNDIESAERCSKCGEWIPEHQSKFHLCENCEEETLQLFRAFCAGLTDDQKELCIWEGIA